MPAEEARRFLALLAGMGAAGAQVIAGFSQEPTVAQATWTGITVILTGVAVGLAAPYFKKNSCQKRRAGFLLPQVLFCRYGLIIS
jgi:hypothetical protein